MGFNLSDYQTVAERLDEALKEHPDMRIITHLIEVQRTPDGRPLQYIMKAEVWLGTILVSTGWAEEIVGNSPVNKTSALENCETSAIGRSLGNFGYQGKNPSATRPTRTEMEKATRQEAAEREQIKQAKPLDWGEPEIPDGTFPDWDPFDTMDILGAKVIDIKPKQQAGATTMPGEITEKQQKMIRAVFAEKYPDGDLMAYVTEVTGEVYGHLHEVKKWEASKIIERLKGN